MKRNKLIKWIRHIRLWFKKDSFEHKLQIDFSEARYQQYKITKCINCRFYVADQFVPNYGICKYNPPSLTNTGRYGPPHVYGDDWCGQFKEKIK